MTDKTDTYCLRDRVRGWLLAACGGRAGLVPANYIKILGRCEGQQQQQQQQPDVVQVSDGCWQLGISSTHIV